MAQTIGKHYVGDDEGDGDVGVTMMRVVVVLMIIVIRTMRGKLTLCAQESPSTSFIVLDPKDLKELGRWGNHDDFEY